MPTPSDPNAPPKKTDRQRDIDTLKAGALTLGASIAGGIAAVKAPPLIQRGVNRWKRGQHIGEMKAARTWMRRARQNVKDVKAKRPPKVKVGRPGALAAAGGAALAGTAAWMMSKAAGITAPSAPKAPSAPSASQGGVAPPKPAAAAKTPTAPKGRWRRFKRLGSNETYFREPTGKVVYPGQTWRGMGRVAPPGMQKYAMGQLTEAQIEQRRAAAKARWANHIPKNDPEDTPAKPAGWTGEKLGLGRGHKSQTSLAPVWRHRYDGTEWGYGKEGPPKEQGGKVFQRFEQKPQQRKDQTRDQYIGLVHGARASIREWKPRIMEDIEKIDRGRRARMAAGKDSLRPILPKNPDPEAVRVAWNLAQSIALNNVGAVGLKDYALSPEMKTKLKPYEGFIRKASRMMEGRLRHQNPEEWAKQRAAFGQEKADGAVYTEDQKSGVKAGEKRKTFKRHERLVKRWALAA